MLVEWVVYTGMEKALQIIARTNGRLFVGAPVCKASYDSCSDPVEIIPRHDLLGRNRDYLDISIDYTMKIVISGKILSMFPSFIRG